MSSGHFAAIFSVGRTVIYLFILLSMLIISNFRVFIAAAPNSTYLQGLPKTEFAMIFLELEKYWGAIELLEAVPTHIKS